MKRFFCIVDIWSQTVHLKSAAIFYVQRFGNNSVLFDQYFVTFRIKTRGQMEMNRQDSRVEDQLTALLSFLVTQDGLVYCIVLHHHLWHTVVPKISWPTDLLLLLHLTVQHAITFPEVTAHVLYTSSVNGQNGFRHSRIKDDFNLFLNNKNHLSKRANGIHHKFKYSHIRKCILQNCSNGKKTFDNSIKLVIHTPSQSYAFKLCLNSSALLEIPACPSSRSGKHCNMANCLLKVLISPVLIMHIVCLFRHKYLWCRSDYP